ncbi:serine protease 38 isoform X2 [Hydra vulgaris]|uniref:Serine protease 38 isoform X2 n=1 Tax=Hydra vulgaris TaxID=6087 RepID=A0ABM4BKF6_HYDVU
MKQLLLIFILSHVQAKIFSGKQAEEACGLSDATVHEGHNFQNMKISGKGVEMKYTHMKNDEVESNRTWPWQVIILSNERVKCNGLLIKSNWILVTASCIFNEDHLQVMINGRLFEAKQKFIHSDFQQQEVNQMANDIALIQLKTRAISETGGDETLPICLPLSKNQLKQTNECAVTHISGDISNIKSYDGSARNLDRKDCKKNSEEIYGSKAELMCVATRPEMKKVCNGRTIMYFICKATGSWSVYGFNKFCSKATDYSKSINRAYYLDLIHYKIWIETIINEKTIKSF